MAIEAARNGAEPIAAAAYPVAWSLHRVAAEVLCDALRDWASSTGGTRIGCGKRRGSSTIT